MISRTNISLKKLREKMEGESKNETTITPRQRTQLRKGLAERTRIRRRKEKERREQYYK